MDKDLKKIYDAMKDLFGLVHTLEDEAVKKSDFRDLSRAELHALAAIGSGRPKTMTHVANLLQISVSTLTTTINKLVRKGYVQRLRDDKDRRIVKVLLTESGRAAEAEIESFREELIRGATANIQDEQLQDFISAIDDANQYFMAKSSMIYVKSSPFELKPLPLGKLVLPCPIVQAGMSIGVAGSRLASAVAIEGGLGLIGTTEIGYRSKEYAVDRAAANVDAVGRSVREAIEARDAAVHSGREAGLIGVSVLWGQPQAPEFVEQAVRNGAQVVVASGLATDLPKYCTDKNIALLPVISSKRGASAIIRNWSQKYNRTPDGFILQGPFAAGLLGFKEEQLYRAEQEWYRIVADVKAEVSKLENCPLIVGGGIFSREDAEKAYKYGADGFLMGTRFVTTEECDAPEEYKRLYLNCCKNDVTIIRSPMKTSVRTMKTDFAERVAGGEIEEYDIFEAVRRGIEGNPEQGLVFCSAQVDRANRIETVREIFGEFTT